MAGYDIQQYSAVIPGLVASANTSGHVSLLPGLLNVSTFRAQPVPRGERPSANIYPITTTQQRELASIAVSGYGGEGRETTLVAEQDPVANPRCDRMVTGSALFEAKTGAA
jgi:hypothetical protein